ncbi:MAG: exodeoxyribonuclease VII large subunit [Candidatus Tectomicrobia bacterium]|nr:exodeoxyribonuclease VII large subunit [Candidatus Tectomicrobia bacterium]
MPSSPTDSLFGRVLTVSQVTQEIKELLEDSYPLVWIEGEISNLRLVQSGHAYFTLKDAKSQLRAVMFRSSVRQLPFTPEAGMQVIARGRLSVYEPRGDYQLIAETIDPKGIGALQIAFEQLKERLFQEGLFDQDRKLPLPAMPQRIGVVTSPTGAAIRDIIQVAHRRSANVHLFLYPVRVQGKEAAGEIVRAIAALNAYEPALDVLIVGRGGGSLEDLWAFNEEPVAWAIAGSEIPIISAIGHETDTTIADFVADLRAPTPSAAAELVVKSAEELNQQAKALLARMDTVVQHTVMRSATALEHLSSSRPFRSPYRSVQARQQQVDDLMLQLDKAWQNDVQARARRLENAAKGLDRSNPRWRWQRQHVHLDMQRRRLEAIARSRLGLSRQTLRGLGGKLDSLSPLAILARGYGICRDAATQQLITRAAPVQRGQRVELVLRDGHLACTVDDVREEQTLPEAGGVEGGQGNGGPELRAGAEASRRDC